MKRFPITIALFLTTVPALWALPARPAKATATATNAPVRRATATRPGSAIPARNDAMLARVTVYWAKGGKGSDHYTRRHQTSTGTRLRSGHCAVDPQKIPYGSRVVLPTGETLAAVDTGTAVKNRKAARQSGRTSSERGALVIDKFFETKGQALAWANTHPHFMPIRVVRPGSQVAIPRQLQVMKAQRVVTSAATSAKTQAPTVKEPTLRANTQSVRRRSGQVL